MSTLQRSIVDINAKRAEITIGIAEMYTVLQQQERHSDIQRQEQQSGILEQHRPAHRNVLLVGPSKSGKTTLQHVLADPRHVADDFSLHSVSEAKPIYKPNVGPSSFRGILNILELPGQMISLTSDLSKINAECADLKIQDFHLIIFCASFAAGIDGTAIDSFERLINHLGKEKISCHLCLIITGCESKSDTQRRTLRDELMQDVALARITQYFGRGIYFSGSLDYDDWNQASEALYYQFETIYNYRMNILRLIESDIEPFHIQPCHQAQPKARLPRSETRNVQPDDLKPAVVPSVQPRVLQPVLTQQQRTAQYSQQAPPEPHSESQWTSCRRAILRRLLRSLAPVRHLLRSIVQYGSMIMRSIIRGGIMLACSLFFSVVCLFFSNPEAQNYLSHVGGQVFEWSSDTVRN